MVKAANIENTDMILTFVIFPKSLSLSFVYTLLTLIACFLCVKMFRTDFLRVALLQVNFDQAMLPSFVMQNNLDKFMNIEIKLYSGICAYLKYSGTNESNPCNLVTCVFCHF